MAVVTVKGTTQTSKDSQNIVQLQGGIDSGRVKCVIEQYVLLGTESAGSTIKLFGTLPSGANIIEFDFYVSAAQVGLTFNLGDSNLATRYASASTALQTVTTTGISGQAYVTGTNSGDTQILLVTAGATTVAGTLTVVLKYSQD